MVSITSTASRIGGPLLPTPTKPIVRRPTLVRKRGDPDTELENDVIPSSPAKRAKVTFHSEVEVRFMGDWEKAPELIRDEVRRAIERHAVGDDSTYERVKEIYTLKPTSEDAPSSTTIRNYTTALLAYVSRLDRSYSSLVHAVLNSQWLGRDDISVALHVRFLGNLVSAQGIFMGDVVRMLVDNMTSSKFRYQHIIDILLID